MILIPGLRLIFPRALPFGSPALIVRLRRVVGCVDATAAVLAFVGELSAREGGRLFVDPKCKRVDRLRDGAAAGGSAFSATASAEATLIEAVSTSSNTRTSERTVAVVSLACYRRRRRN